MKWAVSIEKLEEIWSYPVPVPDEVPDKVPDKEFLENLKAAWDEYRGLDEDCRIPYKLPDQYNPFLTDKLPDQYNPFLTDEQKAKGGVFESEAHSDESYFEN